MRELTQSSGEFLTDQTTVWSSWLWPDTIVGSKVSPLASSSSSWSVSWNWILSADSFVALVLVTSLLAPVNKIGIYFSIFFNNSFPNLSILCLQKNCHHFEMIIKYIDQTTWQKQKLQLSWKSNAISKTFLFNNKNALHNDNMFLRIEEK